MGTPAAARPEPATANGSSREQGRLRLRQLDACLEHLEAAHERGALTVPVAIASAIARYVPAVVPGMRIATAIELVMRWQEPYLAHSWASGSRPTPSSRTRGGDAARSDIPRSESRQGAAVLETTDREEAVPPAEAGVTGIDENGARDLTERIRAAAHNARRLCMLLVEAHERHAWSALGYPTWSEYIGAEFRLSRSRSYELLDHGRVLQALESATGLSGIPDISAYAATQIKPHLAEVVEAIRVGSVGLTSQGIALVADQVVREVRLRHSAERGGRRAVARSEVSSGDWRASHPEGANDRDAEAGSQSGVDLLRLYEAVNILAGMPSVRSTLLLIPMCDAHHLDRLHEACRWLSEFARAWQPAALVPAATSHG